MKIMAKKVLSDELIEQHLDIPSETEYSQDLSSAQSDNDLVKIRENLYQMNEVGDSENEPTRYAAFTSANCSSFLNENINEESTNPQPIISGPKLAKSLCMCGPSLKTDQRKRARPSSAVDNIIEKKKTNNEAILPSRYESGTPAPVAALDGVCVSVRQSLEGNVGHHFSPAFGSCGHRTIAQSGLILELYY
ncbi:unnamed protein product [Danaus chrysippus]|uniref:(African queen) hypothetical protein n=1 Tax=Danaus chrysippus TaxID=151541 RepID=A0A8J2QYP9_9NEOP|nr:unnamed protein product [Danaus chrysippus]